MPLINNKKPLINVRKWSPRTDLNRQPVDYKLFHHSSRVFNLACYCLFLFDKSPLDAPEFYTLLSFVFPCLVYKKCTGVIGHDGERRPSQGNGLSQHAKPTYGTPLTGVYIGRPILTHPPSPPRAKIFPCRNCARDWVLEKFFTQEFDQNSPLLKKFYLGIGGKIFLLQLWLKIFEYENR